MNQFLSSRPLRLLLLLSASVVAAGGAAAGVFKSGTTCAQTDAGFAIGERLTYTIEFDRFKNAGFAEIAVVSKGKLATQDVVELRSRMKTNEIVASAFFMIDESRTVIADASTGFPALMRVRKNIGIGTDSSSIDFRTRSGSEFELTTLIYRLRRTPGAGSFTIFESGTEYGITTAESVIEKIKSAAGEFDTTLVTLQSELFSKSGFSDVRINFSNDGRRLPVLIRATSGKRELRILLAALPEPVVTTPTPSVTIAKSPVPGSTVRPRQTPTPYVDNSPLGTGIPFVIGEKLEYRLTSGGNDAGKVKLEVKERKQVNFGSQNRDSLLLEADLKLPGSSGGILKTWVDPFDLQPIMSEGSIAAMPQLSSLLRFDQVRGVAMSGAKSVQVPVNTHTLLSLLYASRSFNLKPSKDATNPVNDTRVSVFYDDNFHVFTLRPSSAQIITLSGEKVPAQMITVLTGNPQLDALNIKVWLSNEESRVPLRFAVGSYQADLIK